MSQLATLLDHLPNIVTLTGPDVAAITIDTICFDSRRVARGSLFVAWEGRNLDTHRFVPQAIAAGAAAVIGTHAPADLFSPADEAPTGPNITVPYIQVRDSRRALAICAAALHGFPSRAMTVIGITGTDGKTTTCTLLEAILTAHTQSTRAPQGTVGVITTVGARIQGTEQDTGFHVTTPDAPDVQRFLAQMRDAGCRYAVVETTSHGLSQQRVAAVDYDIAAVTNITHEHLDEHGTRAAYVAAKALLFRALYQTVAKTGVPRGALLNVDDVGDNTGSYPALQAALAEEAAHHGHTLPVYAYGLQHGHDPQPNGTPDLSAPDLSASDLVYAPDGTHFRVHWQGSTFPITTQLIGEFNVYNVLCAVGVALMLQVPIATIQQALANFRGISGRMERIDAGQPFLAIVDFAHSPVSLERALLTLRPLVGQNLVGQNLVGQDDAGGTGRLIAVFGSAGLRDRAKRRLMGQVSGRLADITIITAEDPRTEDLAAINAEIAAGVLEQNPRATHRIEPDRAMAIQHAVDLARPGDVVAAFGKGHERSICFGVTEYPWSDQEAMRTALKKWVESAHS